jgi:hypothetical protein
VSERYLTCALMTEGRSDALFLTEVVQRQLSALSVASTPGFSAGPVVPVDVRTIAEAAFVRDELAELLKSYDVVLVHRDHRESAKLDALRGLSAPRGRLVGLVPRAETEAWALCDPLAFRAVRGADTTALPSKPREVERIGDPKRALADALPGLDPMTLLNRIGRDVRLDRLRQIPAYSTWLDELTQALKELHFL